MISITKVKKTFQYIRGEKTVEKQTFSIPNISCGHCTAAIHNELSELPGISIVEGNVEAKTVTVEWDEPASMDQILYTLKEINYPSE